MIILFDGDCHLCNRSVQFIVNRDPNRHFRFASLQSNTGKKLRETYNIPSHMESLILIQNNRYFIKSSAALRICKYLNKGWKLCTIFLLIPTPIRNIVYDLISNNRYRLFGKSTSCMLPTTKINLMKDDDSF